MIITEQERDALMAAIQEYAADYGRNEIARLTRVNGDRYQLRMYETHDFIRAMLTPPDDAVAIPRELAERAADALESISEISAISTQHKTQCAADAKSMKEFLQ